MTQLLSTMTSHLGLFLIRYSIYALFSEIASSLQNKSTSIKPSLQLAIENCKKITCISSDSESGELVSETDIRNRTQNWINNQDPELLPQKARRYLKYFFKLKKIISNI